MTTPPPYPPEDHNQRGEDAPPPPADPYRRQEDEEPLFAEQWEAHPQQESQPAYPDYGQPPYHHWEQPYPPQHPYSPYPGGQTLEVPSGQSRAGIGGIVIFALAMTAYLVGMGVMQTMGSPSEGLQPTAPEQLNGADIMGGLSVLGAMVLNLIGIVVSAFGFAEKGRSKITVWVGLSLNAIPCFGCGGLLLLVMIIGAAAGI